MKGETGKGVVMVETFDTESYARDIRNGVLAELKKESGSRALSSAVHRVVQKAERDLADRLCDRERSHIACAAGCGVCCMVNVAVLFPEAVVIVEHLRENLAEKDLACLTAKVETLYRKIIWLDDEERVFLRRPCAFLDEGGCCSIYPVRPLLCRSVTSTDPERCRQAIASHALGDSEPILMNLLQKAIMEAAYQGMGLALEEAGMDGRGMKLTVAVKHLLHHPQRVSAYLSGAEVPPG
jgi:Fe-S-cluster containining protein